jgi:hypothetical protein
MFQGRYRRIDGGWYRRCDSWWLLIMLDQLDTIFLRYGALKALLLTIVISFLVKGYLGQYARLVASDVKLGQ